jgi:rubredoxin/GNAT superfamily N-acetyltransferase
MPFIRTAVSSDVPRCSKLLEILFNQEHEFTVDAEAQTKALAIITGNPELGCIFVVEINGIIEGMVMLLFTVSTFLGKKVALLEDMVVAPEWRGKGFGSKLINHAIKFAESEGFGRITLLTDRDNEMAQRFYKSKGFSQSEMVVFRKMLDLKQPLKQMTMNAWMCSECGYVYDPAEGDIDNNIKAGTPFERVTDEWTCPVCFAEKTTFELLS